MSEWHDAIETHLVAQRRRLVAYVQSRVGDRDLAEDVFQDSLLRALRAGPALRDADRLVPWFYRILNNGIADYYRRRGVAAKYQPILAYETALTAADEEWTRLCACLRDLLPTLKPRDAALIEALELQGGDTQQVAAQLHLTPNALKVRRHRARQALRRRLEETCRVCAEHGCLDCTCRAAPA